MKEVKVTTIRGKEAEQIQKVLYKEGLLIYSPRNEEGHIVLDVYTETNEDNMQSLMDQLNQGYEEFKKNNPAFAKFVVENLEGKHEWELE